MPKRVDHPIVLGIVGDSASGKTTLSAGVAQILGAEHCTVICTDDYHRYSRAERAAAGLDGLDQHPAPGTRGVMWADSSTGRRRQKSCRKFALARSRSSSPRPDSTVRIA